MQYKKSLGNSSQMKRSLRMDQKPGARSCWPFMRTDTAQAHKPVVRRVRRVNSHGKILASTSLDPTTTSGKFLKNAAEEKVTGELGMVRLENGAWFDNPATPVKRDIKNAWSAVRKGAELKHPINRIKLIKKCVVPTALLEADVGKTVEIKNGEVVLFVEQFVGFGMLHAVLSLDATSHAQACLHNVLASANTSSAGHCS